MVRLWNASPWILGLLVTIGKTGVQAASNIVPGAFLIEYEDGVDIDEQLASVQDVAEPRMRLNHTLFKGASIRFHDVDTAPEQMRLLSASPAIKKMWPLRTYNVPTHEVHWTAGEYATAEEPNGQPVQARQQTPDTFSPHVMTQVDRLRNQGVVGRGIKVAVIDTGVDYGHPALGGCFGPGCLVGFGYDLVGDDYTGQNIGVPDPDPMDNCEGHGTHVSGIVAAQLNNPYGIIGAATGVELGMYRVFGCAGSSADDVLIAAFNMAYEAGADVITASIGGASGWSEEPWAVAVSRIVENGVVCTVSAGNDGVNGLFSPAAAATGKGVASIASFDNSLSPALLINATYTAQGGSASSFGFAAGQPAAWENTTLPLYAISRNTTVPADACDPLPASTPDLSSSIVLVRRGTCPFAQKLTNVARAGARYVVFYNNVASGSLPSVAATPGQGTGIVAIATVAADQGAAWVAALASGQTVTVSMPNPDTAPKFVSSAVNNITGGYMSTYTSWGPTFEVEPKPQFGSPGGNILSTYPRALGSYAVLSGTSMACPLVAGIYALLMEVRGTRDPKTLENLLSSTAKPTAFNNGTSGFPVLAPAAQQGAGLVQAFDAAYATTELSISSLSFNDTDHIIREQSFAIANNGNETVTYTLRGAGAAAGNTLNENSIYPSVFPNQLLFDSASVTFSVENPLIIPAGQRKIVSVTLTPPVDLDPRKLPVYSGYVVINGSDSSALSIPYVGVVGSLKSAAIMGREATYMTSSRSGPNATSIAAGRTFLLPPPGRSNDTRFAPNITDYPVLQYSLAMGSPMLRVDVVPVSVPAGANITESLGMPTVGDVWQTPLEYVARNPDGQPSSTSWDGRLSTGDYAPAGTYKMAVRALKIFGNSMNASDYELYESVEFGIQYMNDSSASAVLRRT